MLLVVLSRVLFWEGGGFSSMALEIQGFWLELVLAGQVFILSFWQESFLINFLLDLF